jgi:hypothetical protein
VSFDRDTLLSLLPRLYYAHDLALAEAAGQDRGPFTELLTIVAEQIGRCRTSAI